MEEEGTRASRRRGGGGGRREVEEGDPMSKNNRINNETPTFKDGGRGKWQWRQRQGIRGTLPHDAQVCAWFGINQVGGGGTKNIFFLHCVFLFLF